MDLNLNKQATLQGAETEEDKGSVTVGNQLP